MKETYCISVFDIDERKIETAKSIINKFEPYHKFMHEIIDDKFYLLSDARIATSFEWSMDKVFKYRIQICFDIDWFRSFKDILNKAIEQEVKVSHDYYQYFKKNISEIGNLALEFRARHDHSALKHSNNKLKELLEELKVHLKADGRMVFW